MPASRIAAHQETLRTSPQPATLRTIRRLEEPAGQNSYRDDELFTPSLVSCDQLTFGPASACRRGRRINHTRNHEGRAEDGPTGADFIPERNSTIYRGRSQSGPIEPNKLCPPT